MLVASAGRHALAAGYVPRLAPPCRRPSQQHQPEGVPPLELTGERTLPDVPAENYWFRRHLAVYEWIADALRRPRRGGHGLRRGLRHRRAGAPRPPRDRRRRQPGGARARARASTRGPACASCATWSRPTSSPATPSSSSRRSSTSRSPSRCSPTSSDVRPAARPTSRRRTCSRSRRRAPTSRTTRGTCASTAPRSSARLRGHLRPASSCYGLFHARKLRAARAGAARAAGTACTRGSASPSRSTTASPRRSRRATSRCARAPLDRALDFVAVLR